MKTLLHIDSSPRSGRSCSRQLTAHFARAWQDANPDSLIRHRDLGRRPVPLVSEDWIAGVFSRPEDRSEAQQAAIAISDELIEEVLQATHLVIGAPMHNFGITACLKAWFDQIIRVGRTIEHPGYRGLVTGKRIAVIATRGLDYRADGPLAGSDAQVPYLRQLLGFLGMTDVKVVCVDNLAAEELRGRSMEMAMVQVERVAASFAGSP